MSIFEFDGEKYKKSSTHQKEWGNKIIAGLNLEGGERALDLGCGDGTLTRKIYSLLPRGSVVGIDASDGMINTTKSLESENLSFYRLDINEMNYFEEFDLIFSNATLHWIKDHKKLLSNCYKALKSGGYIRFNFAGDGNCSNFYKVIKEVMSEERYRQFFKKFEWPWYMPDPGDYKNLLSGCEFKEIKIWKENADRYFNNKDEMIGWIDQPSIVPFLGLIDDENKITFRNEVVEKMVKETIQSDGKCFETFRRINVFAEKG
ncbi:MAG: methyltransferase domain-containing protein [Actinomycetia bacterium]|nr:methyltransferase domain-containing protein [Actinomycetes bacterium]